MYLKLYSHYQRLLWFQLTQLKRYYQNSNIDSLSGNVGRINLIGIDKIGSNSVNGSPLSLQ